MKAGFGCRDREDHSHLDIGMEAGFDPLPAGGQEAGGFHRALRHFQGNFGGDVQGGRDGHGAFRIRLRELRRPEKHAIGFRIGLQQIAQSTGDLVQTVLGGRLPANPGSHHAKRRRESAGQGRDRSPARHRVRRCHRFKEVEDRRS